jgi:hypothetical protein
MVAGVGKPRFGALTAVGPALGRFAAAFAAAAAARVADSAKLLQVAHSQS